jgi:nucleobase transporter 1/2
MQSITTTHHCRRCHRRKHHHRFLPNKNIHYFHAIILGQWGVPIFTLPGFIVIMAAMLASIVESIGDYYACARICSIPPPPTHALNRGITMEGLAGILSGALGSGGNTTSYSSNIGAIGFTKVCMNAKNHV